MPEPEIILPQEQFSNVFTIILSCLGCVVGTGNLWRFPRIVARNSGEDGAAVFYLMWTVALFIWSIPLLIVEYGVGRFSRLPIYRIFTQFFGKIGFFFGGWIIMINFFISSYYVVILSWCVIYIFIPIFQKLPDTLAESEGLFHYYTQATNWAILPHAICIIIIAVAVINGVKAIEKVNCVLVPFLLLILMSVFFYSVTLTYSEYGLQFLFTADWSILKNPSLYLDAISQNAFDTAAGCGLITTYAIYLTKQHSIMRYSFFVPIINNFVSFIASLTIFPTVFGVMLHTYPTSTKTEIVQVLKGGGIAGTGLTLQWIPVLLGKLGILGNVICVFFFICLSFAGLSSVLSYVELFCVSCKDFGLDRPIAVVVVSICAFLVGLISSLDMNFLVNQDSVWGFALIICGSFFMGLVWKYGPLKFRKDIINDRLSPWDFSLPFPWVIIITIIIPIEALGLISWWFYDEISQNINAWYIPSWTSLMTVLIEWLILCLILIIINIIISCLKPKWYNQDIQCYNEGFTLHQSSTVNMPPGVSND